MVFFYPAAAIKYGASEQLVAESVNDVSFHSVTWIVKVFFNDKNLIFPYLLHRNRPSTFPIDGPSLSVPSKQFYNPHRHRPVAFQPSLFGSGNRCCPIPWSSVQTTQAFHLTFNWLKVADAGRDSNNARIIPVIVNAVLFICFLFSFLKIKQFAYHFATVPNHWLPTCSQQIWVRLLPNACIKIAHRVCELLTFRVQCV